jgi:glycosyl transferase family 9 (putative heptosyltransferase)
VSRLRLAAAALRELPRAAALIARHGRPSAVLYFGESPGDDLLASAVLRQWRQVRGTPVWYLTRHPNLFAGNPDVALTAGYSPALAGALSAFGVKRIRLAYHHYDAAQDRSIASGDHIINLMCRSAGLPPLDDPRPLIHLTEDERARARRDRPYVVVQSSVLSAKMPIRNKEWFPDRMQAVVRALDGVEVLQLGSTSDPALEGVVDLRGRTSVREAAAILAGARAFVGMVGFLMHLARAVSTPSVVVFGGREHPSQSGYAVNRNLFTELPCSPCWLWNTCPYDRTCLDRIGADDVIREVLSVIGRGPAEAGHYDDARA